MTIEGVPIPEKIDAVKISEKEIDSISSLLLNGGSEGKEKALRILRGKGLELNVDNVYVEIDGVKTRMTTREDDFGTRHVTGPDILSGY